MESSAPEALEIAHWLVIKEVANSKKTVGDKELNKVHGPISPTQNALRDDITVTASCGRQIVPSQLMRSREARTRRGARPVDPGE